MKYNNRVLHVVGAMNMGGQETFIMNIYRKINRNKWQFDFSVVTPEESAYDKEIISLGGKIYHIISSGKNRLRYYQQMYNLFEKYNIIHMHTDSARVVFLVWLAKIAGCKKIIVHSHSTSCRNIKTHQITKKLLCCTPNIKRIACGKEAGIWIHGKKKFEVIPNGIDMKKYQFQKEIRERKRKEINIQNQFVVGHVGRFCKVKNHVKIINVFENIIKLHENSILLLIGVGEEKEYIKQLVQEKNLQKKVIFLENRSDVAELLQAMDIMIFPSLYEGLSITLIEAQATGLPIVSSSTVSKQTDISGLIKYVDLIENDETWAKIILEVKQIEDRGKYALQLKKTAYDIYQVVGRMEQIYEGEKNL